MSDIRETTGLNAFDADTMIRANGEAQAKDTSELRSVASEYAQQIQTLKELCDRNSAMIEELRKMNVETTKGIQEIMSSATEQMKTASTPQTDIDFSQIQTGFTDSLDQQSAKTQESLDAVKDATTQSISAVGDKTKENLDTMQEKIADLIQQSDDFSHKENVRVYRNIQAATEQQLQKQTQELKDALEAASQPKKQKTSPLLILTFIVALLALLLECADVFGLLSLLGL